MANTNDFKQTEMLLEEMAYAIDKSLEDFAGCKIGFALLVFEFDESGIGNYISNAERESMIKVLRETANKIESKQSIPATIGSA